MNQLSFGAPSGVGPGDACGRCFKVTGSADPYTPSNKGPFKSIIVKVTDLCPIQGNEQWCGQTVSEPQNSFGQSAQCVISFLCYLATGNLTNLGLQLRPVPGLGCPRCILPVGKWRADWYIRRSIVHRMVRFGRFKPLEWRVPRRRKYQ
jgi:hypothetical protein